MNGAFTTGEFAALCGVTKHTLFHYDALGILSPARVGQNGYRYYAPQQLEVFHVIETLRELDIPLSEIRAYLDRRSPGELVELLEREGALLDRKLRRLRQMRDLARQKAALTRSALARTPGVVAEEVQPEALLVCTPSHPMTSDADSARSLAEHVRYCQAHGVRSPHPVGCMLPLEGARSWDLSAYTHFYTQVSRRPGRDATLYVRQAGRYLTLFHTGGYGTVAEGYRRVLDHAAARGLALRGPFFEDPLLDELSVRGYENYALLLSVGISGAERASSA